MVALVEGAHIRELRKQSRITPEELAERIGCYAKDVYRWELRRWEPSVRCLKNGGCFWLRCGHITMLNKKVAS